MSLQIRTFNGSYVPDKEKKGADGKPVSVGFKYDRIVFPWSRTGKDADGKEVEGAVPTFAELAAWAQSSGFPTEVKTSGKGEDLRSDGESIVGFLVSGINSYLAMSAKDKAMNSPESAKEKAITGIMKALSFNRDQAIEFLKSSL